MARFVVAGEALVDLVIPPGGGPPVARPGGSPLNVAVGLARLDHDVLLVTQIGNDPYGELIRDHLEASNVRLATGAVVTGARTSTATATLRADGSASYVFELDTRLPTLELPEGLDAAHVGSFGSWLEPGAAVVRALAEQARSRGVLVTYDPNVRPTLIEDKPSYVAGVLAWTERVDVVKASAEDVEYLVGPDRKPPWRTALDVVTHGGDAVAVAVDGRWSRYVPPPVNVVDTIGAGDTFMAGLLDGLARNGLLTESAIRASAETVLAHVIPAAATAAAITCSREGADPPTRAELDAALSAV